MGRETRSSAEASTVDRTLALGFAPCRKDGAALSTPATTSQRTAGQLLFRYRHALAVLVMLTAIICFLRNNLGEMVLLRVRSAGIASSQFDTSDEIVPLSALHIPLHALYQKHVQPAAESVRNRTAAVVSGKFISRIKRKIGMGAGSEDLRLSPQVGPVVGSPVAQLAPALQLPAALHGTSTLQLPESNDQRAGSAADPALLTDARTLDQSRRQLLQQHTSAPPLPRQLPQDTGGAATVAAVATPRAFTAMLQRRQQRTGMRMSQELQSKCRMAKGTKLPVAELDAMWGAGIARHNLFLGNNTQFVSREARRLLPGSPEEAMGNHTWAHCAVVGNGGGLLRKEHGRNIDRADVVFRLNQAPTARYEKHTGKKTTFRLLNKLWGRQYSSAVRIKRQHLPLEPGVTLVVSRLSGAETTRALKGIRSALQAMGRSDVKLAVLSNAALTEVKGPLRSFHLCARLRGKRYHGGYTPTAGIVAIWVLRRVCEHVSVYGVGDRTTSTVPYQYYRLAGTERSAGNPVHSFDAERDMVRAMAHAGMITWCTVDGCSAGFPQTTTLDLQS